MRFVVYVGKHFRWDVGVTGDYELSVQAVDNVTVEIGHDGCSSD
jgi:hypothetical protein